MIEIGDKVKFLNSVGGGKVTSFQSKKVAVVEDNDGFEIPMLITELVKYEDNKPKSNSTSVSAPKSEIAPKPEYKQRKVEPKPTLVKGNDSPNFFMAFHPSNEKNHLDGEIEVFLVNDSNFSLMFLYSHFDGTVYKTIDSGKLEPNTKVYLEGLSQSDLNNLPKFVFSLIPFMSEAKTLQTPIVKSITVNAVKFYKEKSFTENEYFNGKAMVFDLVLNVEKESIDKLTDVDFRAIIDAKDVKPVVDKPKKIVQPDVIEVDLHIESLVESSSGLTNHEMLELQMSKFDSEMKLAIEKHIKRVIFIHGVGNGVLKQEIARKLKSTYAKYYFQDASFQEYGYGATMVVLNKNR